MKILITGGTGTLGKELVKQLKDKSERLVIFSRDEQKQYEMAKTFPEGGEKGIRYFIGDIRDEARLIQAMQGCDCVIHTAALKHVPACEYNPQESIKTNVIGSMNVINACNMAGIKKCIVISTDKAVHPVNIYGSTKLCMEKMAVAANSIGVCRFSVCRYGNVTGSAGSVIPHWKKLIEQGKPISVTDLRMTRFWISIQEAAEFVINKLSIMQGGEVFVPDIKSKTMQDLINEIGYSGEAIFTGIRNGEKLHECLIGEEDARNCYKNNGFYTIYPNFSFWRDSFIKQGEKMPENFRLGSDDGK